MDPDETYFRDTAHGFLTWALATLLTASFMVSTITAIVAGGAQAGATVVGGAASSLADGATSAITDDDASSTGYFVDSPFRRNGDSAFGSSQAQGATEDDSREAGRILARVTDDASMSAEDRSHLGQMVARRTGLTQQQAEARVTEVHGRLLSAREIAATRAREAADAARKATAYASLWLFIALLGGAFVASLAATYGGRQRDC